MIRLLRVVALVAVIVGLYTAAAMAGQCYTTCQQIGNTQYCTTTCY